MHNSGGPPEPWRSFFHDVDQELQAPVELHCFGGFVLIQAYGVARTTNDVDFINVLPVQHQPLSMLAGQGSPLHRKYQVYLDPVTVSIAPDSYHDRLIPLFPGTWERIKLFALEAHDLALAKLERNYERDRDDVLQLAKSGHLNRETLQARYQDELRPYLFNEDRHDLTLALWIESCWPIRADKSQ